MTASTVADPADCPHPARIRENNSGFASPETTCVTCGQSFDADRERELRARDGRPRPGTPARDARTGYIVG